MHITTNQTPSTQICGPGLRWDGGRGCGRTTLQMIAAPHEAFYVWVNSHYHYPKALAFGLNRADLVFLNGANMRHSIERLYGTSRAVVVDHAAFICQDDWCRLSQICRHGLYEGNPQFWKR